jgi:hypothetical protein
VYNASYRSTGHDHAVGQQDTQRHLALVTKPAVISPPPPQHEGAKLHCAAACDGTEQMSRVPGTPSPNPQPRESARSPTQRVSTAYGGSSALAEQTPDRHSNAAQREAGRAGSAPSTPASFTFVALPHSPLPGYPPSANGPEGAWRASEARGERLIGETGSCTSPGHAQRGTPHRAGRPRCRRTLRRGWRCGTGRVPG